MMSPWVLQESKNTNCLISRRNKESDVKISSIDNAL